MDPSRRMIHPRTAEARNLAGLATEDLNALAAELGKVELPDAALDALDDLRIGVQMLKDLLHRSLVFEGPATEPLAAQGVLGPGTVRMVEHDEGCTINIEIPGVSIEAGVASTRTPTTQQRAPDPLYRG